MNLKKYWPTIAHVAAISILFLNPGVQAIAAAHPAASGTVLLVWAELMHWATSPTPAA